ncbi:hypothetical protein COCMIDRAFT_25609 [Bipolaris oryzae ATCC 44560]|uniref:Uncharacterized protein n=1 Tax=Bipolaris oryzae ATCC 44560 TaxID=930090 RepID=W6Z3S7_COCMI|nr:uncharacterized protein COCMIDRAFT_25609 [Bipolaris oryzae ATCC 44560]EUC46402.1 hypothetical protein COCMIDRAFT_25609 [Bipolaris oryzae ATCC 44560]
MGAHGGRVGCKLLRCQGSSAMWEKRFQIRWALQGRRVTTHTLDAPPAAGSRTRLGDCVSIRMKAPPPHTGVRSDFNKRIPSNGGMRCWGARRAQHSVYSGAPEGSLYSWGRACERAVAGLLGGPRRMPYASRHVAGGNAEAGYGHEARGSNAGTRRRLARMQKTSLPIYDSARDDWLWAGSGA